MARQRKPTHPAARHHSQGSAKAAPPRSGAAVAGWPSTLYGLLATALVAVVVHFAYRGYLETRVNTPFNAPQVVVKSGVDVPELYWGSYRPGVYFGMKSRHPRSVSVGLMWFIPLRARHGDLGIRHWCNQNDKLDKYGWVAHDGRSFGVQEIYDRSVQLVTSFVKRPGGQHGGDWTARIEVKPRVPEAIGERVSLMFYLALDEATGGIIEPEFRNSFLWAIQGETEGLGRFALSFVNYSATEHSSYLVTVAPGMHALHDTVLQGLRMFKIKGTGEKVIGLAGKLVQADGESSQPNFFVHEVTVTAPFSMDVLFESSSFYDRLGRLTGEAFDAKLADHLQAFHARFEDTFHLRKKGYRDEEVSFAEATVSNLVGGMGFFHGSSLVQSSSTGSAPVPYWPASLFSAVPSRSFFPRGFLWDEGFHLQLLARWDLELALDVVAHWMDLVNAEGWIPREQVLGREARARVPEEFLVQRNTNANPPALLLALQYILRRMQADMTADHLHYLERLWPRLVGWYQWFNVTQAGPKPGTYRWRGRDAASTRELNPKTLASGLDDHPRASHPTDEEYHVDLRCWMTVASRVLATLSAMLGKDGSRYAATAAFLSDNAGLDALHWSEESGSYQDFGLHTDGVTLQRPAPPAAGPGRHPAPPKQEKVRVVTGDPPRLRHVEVRGYVSLFPLLLRVLEPCSTHLQRVLQDLRRSDLLWTPFGLRSMAPSAALYRKWNTEHDPPYWRGPIWININYLALQALRWYGSTDGPYKKMALDTYGELRDNVVRNIVREYKRTGYVWEQYDDRSGEGQGSHPFTGWTALVVLAMAEEF